MKKITILLLSLLIGFIGFSRDEVNFTNDTSYEIPEDTTYHCSSLNISNVGIIDNQYGLKQVCVEIESQDDQDLIFYLGAPDGTYILLSSKNGADGNNYGTSDNPTCFTMDASTNITDGTAPFEGQFKPEEDFALFNNFQNANGTWKLCVFDGNGENNSNVTLKKWTLTFGENPPNRVIEINTCDSTWFDTGGESGNYGDNEDYWVKINTDSSKIIKLYFDEWDIKDGNDDRMTIYDGYKTNNILAIGDEWNSLSHTTIQMSDTNSLHYLLIHWKSDGSVNGEGWETSIKCVHKCQKVEYVWDGSTPADDTNYIAVCSDSAVVFNAHGIYADNDHYYHQSDTSSLFVWDFGDGTTDTGTTVNHIYPIAQGYNIMLTVIDTVGCESDLFLNKRVMVSIPPTFNIYPNKEYIPKGDTTYLIQNTQMHTYCNTLEIPLACYDTLPLEDGVGGGYYSKITVDAFDESDTISDVSQLDSLSINIEHSYIGDLLVWLVCPNGTEVLLFDGGNQSAGTNIYLGIPGDDDGNFDIPGNGWDYVFSQNASYDFRDASITDEKVTTLDGEGSNYSIVAGTYAPAGDFSDLIGCPLNGTWKLKIEDDEAGDDGYLFNWKIWFDSTLYNPFSYQMKIVDSFWVSLDSSSIDTTIDPIEVVAEKQGDNRFKYTIVDQFGCSHDTIITIVGADVRFDLSKEDILCYGANNGKVHLTVTAGTVSKYTWENPDGTTGSEESTATTKDWDNLTAGTFTVTVESSDGNQNIKSVEITEPDILIASETHIDVQCYGENNGSIDLTVSGGTSDYTYDWSGPDSYSSTEQDIDSLKPGNYLVTIKDDNDCELKLDVIKIMEPYALTAYVSRINSIPCNVDYSAYLFLSASGGTLDYTYTWSGPDSSFSNNSAILVSKVGYYKFVVKDANGCQIKDSVKISYELPLEQSICIVTVDTATNTNLVIWERGDDRLVKYYNIYRKNIDSDDYLLIDSVSVEDLTEYYDITANPNERSWKYKMSVTDSCDIESKLSAAHKTIYLEVEENGDEFKLKWNDYDGAYYPTISVYRKVDDNEWKLLDSLDADVYSYTDTPPAGSISYIVIVNINHSCSPSTRGTRAVQLVSNVVNKQSPINIKAIKNTNIQIYPNPTKGKIIVQGEDIVRVEVSTASGQKIRDIQLHSNNLNINISKEAKGLYFVKVTTKQGVLSQRIVLE